MNSMIRQTHIRSQDLHDFLCTYDSSNTTAVSIWAKNACREFMPGSLVLIVEPIASPFGLISFVRKEEDNYRVSELSFIVRLENGKAMAVSITNSAYELRFIEVLLEEKARKAIIDRRKFCYIVAKPTVPFMSSALKELERLANVYAKGGTRRNFMSEDGNPLDEPAMALFAACGVHLQNPAGHKQPLDLGLICQSLFGSENKHQDNNRTQLKSTFIPVQNTNNLEIKSTNQLSKIAHTNTGSRISEVAEHVVETAQPQEKSGGLDLLQSWGTTQKSDNFTAGASLFTQLISDTTKDTSIIIPKSENLIALVPESLSAEQYESKQKALLLPEKTETEDTPKEVEAVYSQAQTPKVNLDSDIEEDPIKHLSDAITDLLSSPQQSQSEEAAKSAQPDRAVLKESDIKAEEKLQDKKEGRKLPAVRSFDKLPAFIHPLAPTAARKRSLNLPSLAKTGLPEATNTETSESIKNPPVSDQQGMHELALASEKAESAVPSESESMKIAEPKGETARDLPFDSLEESNHQIDALEISENIENTDALEKVIGEQSAIFNAVDVIPDKLDDFQEPKVVMNEMASLMNKLESQVARAAKKLAVKASEIEHRLTDNLDSLLQKVIQEDKDSSAELLIRGDSLAKEFESLFDTLKADLAENAANCRERIKANLTNNRQQIDETENKLRQNLIGEFEKNQAEFGNLVDVQEKELEELISKEIETLQDRLEIIDKLIEDTSAKLSEKLAELFDNFKKRTNDKVAALKEAFDHRVEALNKDVKFSLTKNMEKLKSSQENFFASLQCLIKMTEIALSRQIRTAQTEFFIPRLKERKQIIEAMIQEMAQTFSQQSFSQAKTQSEGAENSLLLASQQLKELVKECLIKLDVIGRNQQAGLEEIFESAANPLEQKTTAVLQLIKQTEQEIKECEAICNKLAEAYNLDSDPKLTMLRQDVCNKVDSFKVKLKSELESVLDNHCLKLEDTVKNQNTKLSEKRTELVQQVRQASDKGLQNIRQAIHDSYNSVQSQREKYME